MLIKGTIVAATAVLALAGCATKGPANAPAAGATSMATSTATPTATPPVTEGQNSRISSAKRESSLAITAYGRPSAAQKKRTRTSADKSPDGLGNYRRMVKDGEEYFCAKEKFTGSRTNQVETCLTKAQIKAQRENSQTILRGVQSNTGAMPMPDSSGNYQELGNPNVPR